MRWRPRGKPAREPVDGGLFERAVARFNASPAGATVVGLSRTLGAPKVSVGAAAAAPDLIRVTVAWELTWYQWGVDLGNPERAVFELRRGTELAALDAAARQWNAVASEAGRIVLGAPREAAAGGPRAGSMRRGAGARRPARR